MGLESSGSDADIPPNRYYRAYLQFFTKVLSEKGAAATLEEYIFSPKANIEPPKSGQPPMEMTNRLFSGLLHPLIHTGYGAEFGLPGMFAEGASCPPCSRLSRNYVEGYILKGK